jgi:hypothetical protein
MTLRTRPAFSSAASPLRGRTGVELHLLRVQSPAVHAVPGKLVLPD